MVRRSDAILMNHDSPECFRDGVRRMMPWVIRRSADRFLVRSLVSRKVFNHFIRQEYL